MDFNMVIAELLARDGVSIMLLLAAYLDDYLCHEFFCESIPEEHYIVLRDELENNPAFRNAMKKSGVIESGVRRYVRTAMDDYNMFYHFLDGISNILGDPELTCMIPVRDRNMIRSLYRLWKGGEMTEETWETYIKILRRSA